MSNSCEPLVWMRYESEKNGEKVKIRIQQLTEDLFKEAVTHMIEYFFKREPMCKETGVANEEVARESSRQLWLEMMKQGAASVAVLDDDSKPPTVVGVNVTYICNKDDPHPDVQSEGFKRIMKVVDTITAEGNLFEKYGADKYLGALGLSVHPNYHGLNVGLKLLECREKVCKHFGLKFTGTVFTAPNSQYLAKKNGFEVVAVHEYKKYCIDGEIVFPNLEGSVSLMVKVYS